MFPYKPVPTQHLNAQGINQSVRNSIGDIRQPWVDLGSKLSISAFEAKALFALGIMRRYVLSANAVLKNMRHLGFLSASGLLGSGVEILGRCIHQDITLRQDPVAGSTERLRVGFGFIKRAHLPSGVIVATNHYLEANGGYNADDLINLRNLAAHGGCLTKVSQMKGDIELLHELRKAFYGIPYGESDPQEGDGPIKGAVDRYYEILANGDKEMCDRLATSGISPVPLSLQGGSWPFDAMIVSEMKKIIEENISKGHPPISGNHEKTDDYFQLYP